MEGKGKVGISSNFRNFFLRGLGILLPTILTIWILIAAYGFVQKKIARPTNEGVRLLILHLTPWPSIPPEVEMLDEEVSEKQRSQLLSTLNDATTDQWKAVGYSGAWLKHHSRETKLRNWWETYAVLLDMIGLVIAIVVIYIVGVLLGSFIGRRVYARSESLIQRVPLIRKVYPSVKQVTDFLVGSGNKKVHLSRVVAVEYPRKGLWSIGLVTGNTMRNIQDQVAEECMTVFVPSSPTPFTGYVITVPKKDTMELPVTIDEAFQFTVSGGVLIPPSQQVQTPSVGLQPSARQSPQEDSLVAGKDPGIL